VGIRLSTVRRLAIAASACLVLAWPGGGNASSATGSAHGRSDAPNRADAVAVAAPRSATVAAATDRVSRARHALDDLQQRLRVLRTTTYEGDHSILPAAPAESLALRRSRRYAESAANAVMTHLSDAQRELDAAEQEQKQALADYFAALAAAAEAERVAQEETARVAREQAARAVSTPSARPTGGGCAGEISCFLACTRAHESDTAGGYQAVSPDGRYRGAYQFDQTTWNSVAGSIGRDDLVGVNPATVAPADQDTMATALYEMRGTQPWGGRCG